MRIVWNASYVCLGATPFFWPDVALRWSSPLRPLDCGCVDGIYDNDDVVAAVAVDVVVVDDAVRRLLCHNKN